MAENSSNNLNVPRQTPKPSFGELVEAACPTDVEKIKAWCDEQDKKVAQKQNRPDGQAYYGAIGGAYTYMYTPTGLGLIVKIKNNLTEEILDLTDYENW
jgi:hypothetical protein